MFETEKNLSTLAKEEQVYMRIFHVGKIYSRKAGESGFHFVKIGQVII